MAKDILVDSDGELVFKNGDFAVGESTVQNLEHLMKVVPGSLKGDPMTGAAVGMLANKRLGTSAALGNIQVQLDRDAWVNSKVDSVDGENIEVRADRLDA